MKIDSHLHLLPGSGDAGDAYGRSLKGRVLEVFLRRQMGIGRNVKGTVALSRAYLERIAHWVRASSLDRAVLLALDGIYDRDGRFDARRTVFHVENDWAHAAARSYPAELLMGASVHPYRRDALDELERVAELGAVLVKLLPNTQGFDPADPGLDPYYRKLEQLGMPLLIHGGFEHTLPVIDQQLGDPLRLARALEAGVTVIVAHAGTAGLMHLTETFDHFLELLRRYPNCYGDTSALTNYWRSRYLTRLLNEEAFFERYSLTSSAVFERLVHGSDYPIPVTPVMFRGRLPSRVYREVVSIENPLERDVRLKRFLGVPEACFSRVETLLNMKTD